MSDGRLSSDGLSLMDIRKSQNVGLSQSMHVRKISHNQLNLFVFDGASFTEDRAISWRNNEKA